jgi:hypothetical protein
MNTFRKNRIKIATTTLLLMLTITISMFAISAVDAQTVPVTNTRSYIYVGVSPNIVGVGQQVIVVTWTADMPPDVGETAGTIASPNGRAAWNNPTIVTVTKPDGTNETLSMPRTDPVGATWTTYVPETVGTYVLQAYFPGEWKNVTTNGVTTSARYYQPDYSSTANLTVQQDPTPVWTETPLTSDYWNRPLNSANHDWYVLAGNWLGGAATNYPQGTAGQTSSYVNGAGTETPHILWTKQYYVGGLMDENYSDIGYQTAQYGGLSWTGVALNGKISYTPRMTAHTPQGWEQVDLYTGEQLFLDYNQTSPAFGQIYNYESPNQHGGFAYLWRTSGVTLPEIVQVSNSTQFVNGSVVQLGLGTSNSGFYYAINRTSSKIIAIGTTNIATPLTTTASFGTVWEMLDGLTGKTITYIANVTQTETRPGGPATGVTTGATGTAVYGTDGSILRYNIVNLGSTASPKYYLQVWNASAGTMVSSQLGTGYWQWRPQGGTFGGANAYFGGLASNYVHDGRNFFSTNVSIPSILGTTNNVANQTGSITVIKQDEYMIVTALGFNNGTSSAPGFIMKISLVPGQVGTLISKTEFTPPSMADGETVTLTGVYPDDGMILFQKARTTERFGYSMDTGQLVWTSQPEVQFQYYGMSQNYYNHTLYSSGYGGVITAYDVKTGHVNWQFYPESIGTESAYGGVYPTAVVLIADGKLYTTCGEHSPTQPLMRGNNLRCIDATTGKELWNILGFFANMSPSSSDIIMSDGILVGLNFFDNQLYAFGKGPSGTTVTTQNDVSVLGHKVLVTGTVTDQSPVGRRNINDVLQTPLKGTPAISDDSMTAWMEYLFMQQAKPTNATGVDVSLSAIDPNGNSVEIGTTTSDINGNYAIAFDPQVPGTYQIIANFAGTQAYGPSSATSYVIVEDAAQATATPAPLPESIADQYFIPAIAGIIVAIAIVGAILALLLLRKRP